MARGRPRKSAREKLMEGSYAKISVEIFKPTGMPFVPEHLSEDAQACADHIIKNFSAKNISSLDSYVLAVFSTAWAWHKRAAHAMSHLILSRLLPGQTRMASRELCLIHGSKF